MAQPRILLIVSGGIAAYKSLELVRLLKRQGVAVRAVMTASAAEFVTPLSLGVMTEDHVYGAMFDLKEEREIGHIQLSRQADLIVICPATANILAKMAAGIADDLATTILLATDKPVLAVPAMNVRMWNHVATRRNLAQLAADGVTIMPPDEGGMACGEWGPGRLPEPPDVAARICAMLGQDFDPALVSGRAAAPSPFEGQPDFTSENHRPLYGRHILITAGPTHEPIDPVRYIANRSSGKQGFAIAEAAARAGAKVTLITGPVDLATPAGVIRVDVETATEMAAAVDDALPADAAIMVAAVADWRAAETAPTKIKKDGSGAVPPLALAENPDILATLARSPLRPRLLVGFAAETNDVIAHAQAKRLRKGCDWIIANDVAADPMGGDANRVHLITASGVDSWERLPKDEVAAKIIAKVADALRPTLPDLPISVKRLPNGGGLPLPAYASDGAAGMDVVAAESLTLKPGQRAAVATGIAFAIPVGWEIQVRPRSGLALKNGVTCLNTPGTIDSDYRGEVKVILANLSDEYFEVKRGDRIAQLVPAQVQRAVLVEVDDLGGTARGSGGFGSTGV